MNDDTEATTQGDEGAKMQVLGDLTFDEREGLRRMRHESDDVIRRIGLNRVEEARLLGILDRIERKATTTLHEIGKRLDIPNDIAWSVTGDGRAVAAPGSSGDVG